MFFKRKLKILLTTSLFLLLSFEHESGSTMTPQSCYPLEILNTEITRLNSMIIEEIDNYMNFKKQENKLDSELIFKMCDKYSVDPRLLLAQGWLESHWGTGGMAKRTNSVFNVGATGVKYHQIHSKYKYETPNHSIEPYLKLISERYMSSEKTEEDLLEHFVNADNKRYAESPTYEYNLKIIWRQINEETKLDSLIGAKKKAEKQKTDLFVKYMTLSHNNSFACHCDTYIENGFN